MKVLITGGSGFLGTNLINYLIKKNNYEVFSIDKKELNLKTILNNQKVNHYKLNLNNRNLINVLKEVNPEIIFNLAAETHVDRSIDNPNNFINSNIKFIFITIFGYFKDGCISCFDFFNNAFNKVISFFVDDNNRYLIIN